MNDTERKLERLHVSLGEMGSALVAFSGGVDSTFLLSVAQEILGSSAAAAIADSPSLPRSELKAARELATQINAPLHVVPTGETDLSAYRANGPDRCYHCKRTLFIELDELARREGYRSLLYGAIPEDATDVRPGHQAAREFSVRAPLSEVGLTKDEIRRLSRARGLPTWDKPAFACLASRIPHGTEVTPQLLARIESAEEILRQLGFTQFRLRHHGPVARIELDPEELPRATAAGIREKIVTALNELGWPFATLDLAGYQTGSLHRIGPPAF